MFRGSGVRETRRISLPLCEGDCCLRWLDGEPPEDDWKRPCGLGEALEA